MPYLNKRKCGEREKVKRPKSEKWKKWNELTHSWVSGTWLPRISFNQPGASSAFSKLNAPVFNIFFRGTFARVETMISASALSLLMMCLTLANSLAETRSDLLSTITLENSTYIKIFISVIGSDEWLCKVWLIHVCQVLPGQLRDQ